MDLVLAVYEVTRHFPKEEVFGLAAQLRRAAISVPSNIAEGAARRGSREFVQFLSIALGSLAELETQLELAVRLGYVRPDNQASSLHQETARLLTGLRRSLDQRSDN